MSLFALTLLLVAAPAPAVPSPPVPPRTGTVTTLIHSESFKHPLKDQPQSLRVDYNASLTWTLTERKHCAFWRCGAVCDMTVGHKVLSRQIWWTPPIKPAVLAEDSPAQREYPGGVVTFDRACAAVPARDVARIAAERLRPYQFADELIKDRPQLSLSADNYFEVHPPTP